jgi:hypothetical protein
MKFTFKIHNYSFIIFLLVTSVQAQNNVTLRRTFVDSLRNTVSITGEFIVDKAHKNPNKPVKDGDLHVGF